MLVLEALSCSPMLDGGYEEYHVGCIDVNSGFINPQFMNMWWVPKIVTIPFINVTSPPQLVNQVSF